MEPLGEAIDNITVNLKKTSVENALKHFAQYGLITEEPEECSVKRVLGLQLFRNEKKELYWERGNIIPKLEDIKNEKDFF